MDIQNVASAVPTPQAGANAASVQATGKSVGAGNSGFAAILGGHQAVGAKGPNDSIASSPNEQTMSLLALMQVLQSLLAPLNNQAAASGSAAQQASASLPELLLQAINSPSELSDKVLEDPNVQQWLAQAAALIPALSANSGSTLTMNPAPNASAAVEPAKLSAQETLLQFANIAMQLPDNPIVRHLLADLQKTVEPMLTNVAQPNQSLAEVIDQVVNSAGKSDTVQISLKTASRAEQPADMAVIVVQRPADNQVEQIKAKLEMLAAKSGGVAAAIQQTLSGTASEQGAANESSQDDSLFQTPALPLQDLLKTLQQAEKTIQAPETTVNAQTFVRDMSDYMVKNMKLSVGDVFKEATLSLHPDNLGQVDVKITLHANGQLVAQLTADTLAGKQLLESQLPQLRQALQSQGLQVERLEVAQEAAASSGMFQQSRQQGGDGQPSEREMRGRGTVLEGADGEFAKDLRTLADHRSGQNDASGSSFDATV